LTYDQHHYLNIHHYDVMDYMTLSLSYIYSYVIERPFSLIDYILDRDWDMFSTAVQPVIDQIQAVTAILQTGRSWTNAERRAWIYNP